MLNNCYTVHQSPVFRNPKSNIAVQQLTQYINNTQGRVSPLHPSVKKIVGIKKNSSTDHQLPLCEVPFQTNLFAQQEQSNDIAYSNRGNLSTNRQFSRNQRTHSVYTGNKENYVRSPTRSPFQKPVLQRECYTPIYSKSPLQKVSSPGVQTIFRQTNQRGFGHISPLRLQQKVYQKEPQLCEMVDNLKQNIIRDIQEVTKKYTMSKPQEVNLKQQEFKKQQYLEQQAQILQQQLEFIKTQQSKYQSQQSDALQCNKFKKSIQENTQKTERPEYQSNYFNQQSKERQPLQILKDLNQQPLMISQLSEQVDLQEQNKQIENYKPNLFMSPTALKFEKQINFADQFKQKQYSPINFTGQSGSTNTNTFSSQSELAKLKSLQLELMQNKPLFEQPIQSKIELNIKKQQICDVYTEKQEFKFEERKSIDLQKQKNETMLSKQNSNLQSLGIKAQRNQIPAYLPPFTKMVDEMDDDYNNQVTISNLSSIVPAEVSANQNKKINVSFESSLEQPQFEYCKGSDCRNTFGPMQLEHILKQPNCEIVHQPDFNLNSSRNQEMKFTKQMPKFNYELFAREEDKIQQNLENSEIEDINNNQSLIEIKEDQVSVKFQTLKTRSSKSVENSGSFKSKKSTQKTPSHHNTNEKKEEEKQIEVQVSSPMNLRVSELNRESPINRKMTDCSANSSNKQQQTQKLSEKKSSHQSQRYENNNEVKQVEEVQDFSSNNSLRYEQILQNFQNLKNQSKVEQCIEQPIKQSVKVNECQHISDFIVFCEKNEGTKKKTVTFNENLIQQSLEQQKATSFSDFMKTKADIQLPESNFAETVVNPVQPRAGISFLQYKQQLEN